MSRIEAAFIAFGDLAWGPWLLILILGGGIYFLVLSRLMPFRYLSHSIALLSGKYDDSGTGEITHFQALSSALAGTIGMGNILFIQNRTSKINKLTLDNIYLVFWNIKIICGTS